MAHWSIETGISITRQPEEIFRDATNIQNATKMIPLVEKADIISGKERAKGTIYEFHGSLGGLIRGAVKIEIVDINPPHSAKVKFDHGNLPLLRITEGTADLNILEREADCRVTVKTAGEVRGLLTKFPNFQELLDLTLKDLTVETLTNLRDHHERTT